MNVVTTIPATANAAFSPAAPAIDRRNRAGAILLAAGLLLPSLERGRAIDINDLRAAMTQAFGGRPSGASSRTFGRRRSQAYRNFPRTLHVVTGLLLPIWRRLPDDDYRVYRLQTDSGERIIGRHIAPAAIATMYRNLGLDHVPTLSADEAWSGLLGGRPRIAAR